MSTDPIRTHLAGVHSWTEVVGVLAALTAVLDMCALCNDCQHGYAVPVEYLRLEMAAALGVEVVES